MRLAAELAWTEIRTARARSRALIAAVALGAACVVATTVLGATMQQQVEGGSGVEYAHSDLLVRSEQGVVSGVDGGASASTQITRRDVATMADLPGVAATAPIIRTQAAVAVDDQVHGTLLETIPADDFRWQQVSDGRLPEQGTEIALSEETLGELDVEVGDQVALGTPVAGRAVFTVVGSIDVRGSLRYASLSYGIVTEQIARNLAGISGYNEVQIRFADDADPDVVVDAVNASVPVGFPLLAVDAISATEQLYGSGLGVLGGLLSGFALIAALIAVLVLATVISATVPARRSNLAVLRAVGATREQIRGAIALEVGALALIGGIAAVPLGLGAAALGVPLIGRLPSVPAISLDQLQVPWVAIVLVPVLACLLGVVAALVPAWLVGRIPPAEALRASATDAAQSSFRSTVTVLVLAIAVGLLAIAAIFGSVIGAAVAGVAVAASWVAATPIACRYLAGVGGRLSRRGLPIAELTAAQLQRFPGRITVTGLAAMVAAAMLALSWVVLDSIDATVDSRALTDPGPQIMVGAYAGGATLTPGTTTELSEVTGIAETLEIRSSAAELRGPRPADSLGSGSTTRLSGNVTALSAVDLERVTDGQFPLTVIRTDTAYLPESDLRPFEADAEITIEGTERAEKLRVEYVEDLPFQALIAPATLEEIGGEGAPIAVWLGIAEGADRPTVVDDVRAVAVLAGGQPVSGSAPAQARVDQAIDLARGLATGMLVISIVIALLGAALTVATSVRERSTELATLRLIGMDGAQVRGLVAAETWVVAAVSVLAGLALGVVLGAAAVVAAANALGLDPVFSVPVLPLLGLALLVVVGVRLAITGPLDRVSGVAPAQALRDAAGGH